MLPPKTLETSVTTSRRTALAAALLIASIAGGSAHAQPAAVGQVVLVVTIKVKADKTAEFETMFREFVGKVRASGLAIAFQLTRTTTPGTYKLVEIFRDEAALAAHRATPHVRALGPVMTPMLDAPNQAEQLAAVE